MSEENLYQRGSTWWLRATVGGVEVRESLRTRDVKAARRLRDTRLAQIKAQAVTGEKRVSWRDAVTAWVDHAVAQFSSATAKRYGVSLAQYEKHFVPLMIDEIDGKTIAAFISARRGDGATPATVRRDLTAISRVLEFTEAMEWREGNPTLSKRRLLKERRDPIALPTEEAIEAISAAASPQFGALTVLTADEAWIRWRIEGRPASFLIVPAQHSPAARAAARQEADVERSFFRRRHAD